MKSRVVFDCMVFLQGAGRPTGPARACFRLVDEDRVTLCVSAEVLAEVRDVLTRPKVRHKFPLLSGEWVETFVRNTESKALVLTEIPEAITLERDPKDEPYLNVAVAAKASYLVSRDRDLLDLMRDENFRQRYPELLILDPVAFLHEIARQEETTSPIGPKTGPKWTEKFEPQPGAEGETRDADGIA